MRKALDAFLWRNCNQATLETLIGKSEGQYDIRLNAKKYEDFFVGLSQTNQTDKGGFDMTLPIQPFIGPNPVEASELVVRFMGPTSVRRDWYIRSQRPDTAYKLWHEGRGFISKDTVGPSDYLVIVRDVDNGFHARWVRTSDFNSLPEEMKQHMSKEIRGWAPL